MERPNQNEKYALAYATNGGLPVFTKEDLRCLSHIKLAFRLVKNGPHSLSIAAGAGEYFVQDTEMNQVAPIVDCDTVSMVEMLHRAGVPLERIALCRSRSRCAYAVPA